MKKTFCDRCNAELLKRDFGLGKFEFCKQCAVSFESWLKVGAQGVGVTTGSRSGKIDNFIGELDNFLGVKKK